MLRDELFLLGGRPPPQAGDYDSFPQIENGIGMVRTFSGIVGNGES